MKKKYLIGLFIFLTLNGYSQFDNYIKGFVIKESKDTIFGKLKDMSDERSCSTIKFIDPNGNRIKFKNKDVYAYKRGNDLYFKKSFERPVSIGKMQGFMKIIVDGEIKLYQFNYAVRNAGTMNSDGVMTGGGTSYQKDYYVEKDDEHILVRKGVFKNTMSEYFSDNKDLSDKINSRELKYRDMEKIVRIYNKDFE